MEIDIKKVMEDTPKNVFDAIDMIHKSDQRFLDALHIMQSCLKFPEMTSINENRMRKFLNKYTK